MDHQTEATKADAISKAEITIISNSKRQYGPNVSGSAMGAPSMSRRTLRPLA